MFQRLKATIDSRIAEEQARQKTAAGAAPVSRSNSIHRSSSSRTESTSTKPRKPKAKETDGTLTQSTDPAEFEAEFIIEDEDEQPSETIAVTAEDEKMEPMGESKADAANSANVSLDGKEKGSEKGSEKPADVPIQAQELPEIVRKKLHRLELLEPKYRDLLRNYRVAHARAVSIEPFEKVLKENTPLTTITDHPSFVDYLNQVRDQGAMVKVEFSRTCTERDDYKRKFEESEKQLVVAREELEALKSSIQVQPAATGSNEKAETISIDTPTASAKSPVSSVLGLFSSKEKPQVITDDNNVTEEFFSYDDEIPKLQTAVEEKTAEVVELKFKVASLEAELSTAQESSSGLVENLEKATRELNESKDAVNAGKERAEEIKAQTEEIHTLKGKLEITQNLLDTLRTELANANELSTAKHRNIKSLERVIAGHVPLLKRSEESLGLIQKERNDLRLELDAQAQALEDLQASDAKRIEELEVLVTSLTEQLKEETGSHNEEPESKAATSSTLSVPATTAGGKKKSKKKKKGGNAAASTPNVTLIDKEPESVPSTSMATDLQAEVSRLKEEIADRDAQIEKLQKKRKTEEDLREQIQDMEDNFLQIGQEHVEAKQRIKDLLAERTALQESMTELEEEKIKKLQTEKAALQENIVRLEEELETYKTKSKYSDKTEADLKSLMVEYEDLKQKSATLQTDLGAAEQLATSRFKKLSEFQDAMQQARSELLTLRVDKASLKATKDELATRTSELRRLESREKDLRSDVTSFKKQAADRETEIRNLNEKVTQETNGRLRAEDQVRNITRDLRKSEAEKIQISASEEKASAELAKIQVEAGELRNKVRDLEGQVSKLTTESQGLREEVELRGSQCNNAQGLLDSMTNQFNEMATQLKEAKSQGESHAEELVDLQRLLMERTREGESIRNLTKNTEQQAAASIDKMRKEMEAAIEERDRAEDEASRIGRSKSQEVNKLKEKVREIERDLKQATDDRDELQQAEKEWKRKRDDLEEVSEKSKKEVEDMRSANGELHKALEGSEKQTRDAEKQRTDLKRLLDQATQRYEKLSKGFEALHSRRLKNDVSSRSSMESARAGSPPVNDNARLTGEVDPNYLKQILLQFLEQKDKKIRDTLINTVLTRLLNLNKQDREKWTAAISAK